MGGQPTRVDVALIGHPESWLQVRRLMDSLRDPDRARLEDTDVRDIFPWIPARAVERFTIASAHSGRTIRGAYIETFIPPDRLDPGSLRANLRKVEAAIRCATREGARIASLGGFTSIVMERGRPRGATGIPLTTGNTLTAAFIVRGVERAAERIDLHIGSATVCIMGSTGDLGSACTNYFSSRARRVALCGRRAETLREQATALAEARAQVVASTDITELLPEADVVIAVASLKGPTLDLSRCRAGTLVCDAGYPKNLAECRGRDRLHLFWGGMGQARGGWVNDSQVGDSFYRFPAPGVGHGCMLEGMVLGLDARYEAFSQGRGNITEARMEEILDLAERHGVVPAPLFGDRGLWPGEPEVA